MTRRLVLALVLLLAVATPALGDDGGKKREIDAKIASLHDRLAAQKDREASLRGQIADVTGRIRDLEQRVGDVSLRLHTLEQDLALHQERLDKLTELYRLQTKRFDLLKRNHVLAMKRLNGRLLAIYESDNPTTIDVVLGADSIQDAMDKLEFVKQMGEQDRQIAQEVERSKRQVRAARARTAKLRGTVQGETQAISARTAQTRDVRNELVGARN